ncbi:hypothetical protein B7C51_14880 [Paenibacillus larvae subsp. pulvifaciens]|uniref:Uncharacterized protein n=1 Tax=Paenibacillus larvae subsp. pulvifaciens TaxID=1477 RepID=A0A1V0UU68_9BACL|nr:hypothetical protein [Paenibacillus larvae]ARF68799.1 hypothetical protein B7C51_14880 [Paenibacillus larvae subsp. pulvifaciens]
MLLYQMIRMLEDKTALDIAIREQNGDGDALMREKARLEEQIRKQASRWQSEFADSDLGRRMVCLRYLNLILILRSDSSFY